MLRWNAVTPVNDPGLCLQASETATENVNADFAARNPRQFFMALFALNFRTYSCAGNRHTNHVNNIADAPEICVPSAPSAGLLAFFGALIAFA